MSKEANRDKVQYKSFMGEQEYKDNVPLKIQRYSNKTQSSTKGHFDDSYNLVYHFSYDSSRNKYIIPEKEMEELCDILNNNTPDVRDLEARGARKEEAEVPEQSLEEKLEEYRSRPDDLEPRGTTGRATSFTLLFEPITKESINHFLKDLVNLRGLLETRKMEEFEENSQSPNFRLSEEYRQIPSTTTLSNFQDKLEEESSLIKRYERCVPLIILAIIIILVLYMLIPSHKGSFQISVLVSAIVLGLSLLGCFFAYKKMQAKKRREELKMLGLKTLGRDPKIRELIYRFNKARLKTRRAKAIITADCDLVTFEVEIDPDNSGNEDPNDRTNSFYYS